MHVLLVLCEIGELDLCTQWRVDLFYGYREMLPYAYGTDGWLCYHLSPYLRDPSTFSSHTAEEP